MHNCPRCEYSCDCDQEDLWNDAASAFCVCDCEYAEEVAAENYDCDDDVLAALDDDYVRRSPNWIKDIVIYSLAYNFRAWRDAMNEVNTFAADHFWQTLSPYYQISNRWFVPWDDDLPF